jgi:hypothetical protein
MEYDSFMLNIDFNEYMAYDRFNSIMQFHVTFWKILVTTIGVMACNHSEAVIVILNGYFI